MEKTNKTSLKLYLSSPSRAASKRKFFRSLCPGWLVSPCPTAWSPEQILVESVTATNELLENVICVVGNNNVGRACPIATHNLFPRDRCGCKQRAALNPAAVCSLFDRQRELPRDSRNAPAPGRGHAETRFTGTETFGIFLGLGNLLVLMDSLGRLSVLHHVVHWKMCTFKSLLREYRG